MNFLQTFRSSKRELFHTLSQSPFLKLPTLEVKQPSLILPDHHYQRPYPKAGGVAVEQASAKNVPNGGVTMVGQWLMQETLRFIYSVRKLAKSSQSESDRVGGHAVAASQEEDDLHNADQVYDIGKVFTSCLLERRTYSRHS
ncbi:hypothetical protein L210DRAFT_3628023 [Boletus edulis BED1]|uniref:Uncharacterized protein n=1 Tax=Boletus edulis BED1 TaxID=1328754 RepID=A0AAD4C4A2_BOLED|nr:hypothetical protein L210DRAFT_3628023 [Boletus edulis BED1]